MEMHFVFYCFDDLGSGTEIILITSEIGSSTIYARRTYIYKHKLDPGTPIEVYELFRTDDVHIAQAFVGGMERAKKYGEVR